MTAQAPCDRIATYERFHTLLVAEQAHRDTRTGERASKDALGRDTTELAWIVEERLAMLRAVNDARAELGLPLADLSDVTRVEQMAVGHSDYTRKFALYCAELAVGDTNIRP